MSRNALGGSEICDDQLGNYGGSKSEKKRLVKSDSSLSRNYQQKIYISTRDSEKFENCWELNPFKSANATSLISQFFLSTFSFLFLFSLLFDKFSPHCLIGH